MAGKLAELWVEIGARLDKFNKGMNDVEKATQRIGKKFEKLGKEMTKYISVPLAAVGGVAIKMAMDAVESENLFTESMRGMADSAREWSNKLRDELGLNSYEVRKMVGTFHVMLKSMGLSERAAYDMAKSLTELGYDMASFYNLKPEEAFDKLKSGIVGMPRPLQDLGIIVNETAVKTWALTKGIIKQGEELNNNQKIIGRFNVIMNQTKTSQGDLARTIQSPANQFRILKSRVQELTIEIGIKLLPVFQKLLNMMNFGIGIYKGFSDSMKTTVMVTGALAAAFGPIVYLSGKLMLIIPAIVKSLKVARAAFIGAAGGTTILLGALWGLIYGMQKYKEAQKELEEAEKRHHETTVGLGKKLKEAAELAGLSTKEYLKLRDAYAAQYGTLEYGLIAMTMAIRKGKEGKELQEALAKVSAKHKEEIDKQRISVEGLSIDYDKLAKELGNVIDKEETFTDFLRDQGIMTLEEKSKRVEQLSGYMVNLEELFKTGKITAEDYAAAIKKIKDEIVELTEYMKRTALPAHRDTAGILENAQEKLEDNIYGYKTFKQQVAEWAEKHGEAFISTMYDIMKYSTLVTDVFDQLYANQMMRIDNEEYRRREMIENSRMSEEERMKALEALENEMEKRRRAAARKQAARSKTLALFEAIVNTASAVVEALPNIPLSILVGALGAAQIAAIAGAPLPSLQKGGLVPSPMPVFAGHGPKGEIVMSPERIARIITEEMPKLARTGTAPAPVLNYAPVYHISAMDSYDVERFVRERATPETLKMLKSKVFLDEYREALKIKT